MKVDVIDMADANLGNDRANRVRNYSDAIIKMYPMSNGIIQMVDNVYNMIGAPGSFIEVLRIWGHGWAGGQLVAAGTDGQSGADNASALWGANVNDYAYYLQKLCDLFQSNAHVELKGCQVGQGDKGEMFLIKLAVIFNIPVQAAQLIQGGAGSNLTTPGLGWDGTVVEATPDYAVKYVQGSSL
jgi:hypothetical protein